jgi:hypothetical protein
VGFATGVAAAVVLVDDVDTDVDCEDEEDVVVEDEDDDDVVDDDSSGALDRAAICAKTTVKIASIAPGQTETPC